MQKLHGLIEQYIGFCREKALGVGFYVYKPERIEYIVKGDESEEELDKMEKCGISPVKLVRTHLFSE